MKPIHITFENSLALDGDGWAQLAPFGDFPGQALLEHADGRVEKVAAIQRLDRAAAQGMVERFKSPWGKLKRFFTGCPVYAGHPDVPALANDYNDHAPKGMITDLQIRADGLYARPVFTREGTELVETKTFTALSGYWSAVEVAEENGKRVFRPEELRSVGLTNRPNLPVKTLVNEQGSATTASEPPLPGPLLQGGEGIPTFAPAHFPTVMILNAAIAEGRLKTPEKARTKSLGLRKVEFACERQERTSQVHELVRERMATTGEDYQIAFAFVQEGNPGLFHSMAQPTGDSR